MVQKILMICLGNICRSPIAETVMTDVLVKLNLQSVVVDSAAIGPWHVGKRADPRALSTLKNHDLKNTHIVRQITKQDFNEFDYIFGMDEENMSELRRLAPNGSKAELLLLGDFGLSKENRIIEDPYYERGDEGFEVAYQQCVVACKAFAEQRLQK
ncbi:low molecular weight phosphotyrosine protein phosphatase 1 [Drosophila grimshawi]|uniref:Low molecular weight phosphotyrosine protein phosphatase n=1 Tax=Drosophila grimshawi TaxID=7222 RepID=B4JYC1_DROGR|nr:low molecular weight phosphotyrosine protein phosphatase 1 [Drosophila grimshawi]EDV90683.1 GH14046 [Drosophila grimshawi]